MKFKKIYIEITNICNLNCSFCSDDKRTRKEMNAKEFEIVIKKIKGYTKTIYLHVKGEPLLHSNLEEILYIASKYNLNVRITSNGTLLKEKLNILTKFNNIKQINISLHSENKKPNYFESVFEACDILSTNIPIVYRIWTLNNYKLNKLSTMIVDKIINYYKLDNSFMEKVINNNNIQIQNNIYLDKDNLFDWPNDTTVSNQEFGTCLGTRTHIAILSDGTVIPCCLDSNANIKLGNIFDENLEDILNKDLFKNINQGFKDNKLTHNLCKNCTFRNHKFK